MPTLITPLLLPLAIIVAQITTGASGGLANAAYKLAFIVHHGDSTNTPLNEQLQC